ncbi:MAG: hypothetical protein ABIA93_03625 [Candidatus Woesearchaeota archaeon]
MMASSDLGMALYRRFNPGETPQDTLDRARISFEKVKAAHSGLVDKIVLTLAERLPNRLRRTLPENELKSLDRTRALLVIAGQSALNTREMLDSYGLPPSSYEMYSEVYELSRRLLSDIGNYARKFGNGDNVVPIGVTHQ